MLKKSFRILSLLILYSNFFLCDHYSHAFSAAQVLGDAAEGLMQDFFVRSGWEPIQGQIGRQGFDGLFVKRDNSGNIRDVLSVESKHNTSKLGTNLVCGETQMSYKWHLCKIDSLIERSEQSNNTRMTRDLKQIRSQIVSRNYRARILNTVLSSNGELSIGISRINSRDGDVSIEPLSGGEKYKLQYTENQKINLSNPKNQFQRQIADNYFKQVDAALQKQGLSKDDRNKFLSDLQSNPGKLPQHLANIDNGINKSNPNPKPVQSLTSTTPERVQKVQALPKADNQPSSNKGWLQSQTEYNRPNSINSSPKPLGDKLNNFSSKVSNQVKKRAGKSFINSLKKGVGRGIQGGMAGGVVGPAGMAIGFFGGIAISMVADYLVEDAIASENDSQKDLVIAEIRQIQSATEERISAVENRMVKEFEILGEDIQNKHEITMTAIKENQKSILQLDVKVEAVSQKIDKLLSDLANGISLVQQGFDSLEQKLVVIEGKLDTILETVRATITAKFKNGVELFDYYESTKNEKYLESSLYSFLEFIHMIDGIKDKSNDDYFLRSLSCYYMIICNIEFASLDKSSAEKAGHCERAVNAFIDLTETSKDLSLVTASYLSLNDLNLDAATAKKLESHINKLYESSIRESLASCNFNAARNQSFMLDYIMNNESSYAKYVVKYLEAGRPVPEINFNDPIFQAIKQYFVGKSKSSNYLSLLDYAANIVNGSGQPTDFIDLLTTYDDVDLVKSSVRELVRSGYFHDALEILKFFNVDDDNFRLKSYLIIYKAINPQKKEQLKDLILSNPKSYSRDLIEWAGDI